MNHLQTVIVIAPAMPANDNARLVDLLRAHRNQLDVFSRALAAPGWVRVVPPLNPAGGGR